MRETAFGGDQAEVYAALLSLPQNVVTVTLHSVGNDAGWNNGDADSVTCDDFGEGCVIEFGNDARLHLDLAEPLFELSSEEGVLRRKDHWRLVEVIWEALEKLFAKPRDSAEGDAA